MSASPGGACCLVGRALVTPAQSAIGRGGIGVGEGDVAEAHPALDRVPAAGPAASGLSRDLRLHVEVLEDAVEERQRALHLDLHVEQLAQREEEPRLQRGEGHDVADAWGPWGRPG